MSQNIKNHKFEDHGVFKLKEKFWYFTRFLSY